MTMTRTKFFLSLSTLHMLHLVQLYYSPYRYYYYCFIIRTDIRLCALQINYFISGLLFLFSFPLSTFNSADGMV